MFTHLHLHTEYSLLDGLCRITPLLQRTREMGMESLAITDHGVLYGAMAFYREAKAAGIRPILGCEVYVSPKGRTSREDKSPHHLVLLARNNEGYRNLIQLVSKAHLEGFYYKPRVDREILEQHSQGLIALSACLHGELARLVLQGRREDAAQTALWYKNVFSDFYLELQDHGIPDQPRANRELVSLGHELGIPLVATNDVHYIEPKDAKTQDVLLCIQTNTTIHDEKRLKMADESFYLRSPQEMAALFPELPEAAANTQRIAEACSLELEFGRRHLPEIELPPGMTPDGYLEQLCRQGLRQRYPEVTADIEARATYELEVIRQTQFANYFLVVWDLIAFARKQGILFGVRGSAAASIVLYCLGVTDIEPLSHKLVFERFLNIERHEMPDIDLDFQDDRRDEMLAYAARRYGADHVAQIITFGTLGAKAVLRDVGRAVGMPYSTVDQVARLVPPALNMTIEKALGLSHELQDIYQADETVKKLVDTARGLEGVARHASTHAAGVVISQEPLTKHVPLQRPSRGEEQGMAMTQFAMDDIAYIGLLKMDFLGLANLTILERTREAIARDQGQKIDLQHIPLDDAKTYQLLSSGETTGVFQLESSGMRRYIRDLKPTTFSDIASMVALYRPGPMQHLPTFIRAKHGLEPIRYPHPALAPILEDTYGVIVFQDQVLQIARTFAGYTLGQADIVRKAMGKKIPEVMKEERQRFIKGAIAKGFDEEVAAAVFDLIEPFAGYAFNKAHSVSYAMIAYQTAYLKANFPAELMASVLSINMGQPEKIAAAVAECRRLGINVLPPDVNHSQDVFTIERDDQGHRAVRFGLAAIKNVGASALKTVFTAREEGGPFSTIEDLCRRADLRAINRRMMESLIKAGALDALGDRGSLLLGLDRILALSQREQRLKETGQATMFDLWGQTQAVPLPGLELPPSQVSPEERLSWERDLMGIYLSDHPFSLAHHQLAGTVDVFCGQINEEMAGQKVFTAGRVVSVRPLVTKDNRQFLAATLEDLEGSIEVTVWSEVYEKTRELWAVGNILHLIGKVRMRDDRVQLHCERVRLHQPEGQGPWQGEERNHTNHRPFDKLRAPQAPSADSGVALSPSKGQHQDTVLPLKDTAERQPAPRPPEKKRVVITLEESQDAQKDQATLREVFAVLQEHPGRDEIRLSILSAQGSTQMRAPSASYTPELHSKLAGLVGEGSLKVEKAS